MDIGRQPDHIPDVAIPNRADDRAELGLESRPVRSTGPTIVAGNLNGPGLPVGERHTRGDDLPGCGGVNQPIQ